MASTTELLIRVMADTSQADRAFAGFSGNLGKAIGIGSVGVGAAALTEAATQWQTSMARIAVAYNDVNFAPGTAKFEAVQTFLRDESTKLATTASDLGQIYQVAARYAPDSTAKAMEFTDTVARLMQVSHDLSDPTQTSQDLAKFLRIFNDTNAAGVGAAIAQLSTMHTQGEAPVMTMAQNLALAGVQFGLSEAQVLGLSNVLVDAGVRVNTGGTAISRMFLQLGQAAATVGDGIDENSKKIRDGVQQIADLQDQLARTQSPAKGAATELKYQEDLIKAKLKAAHAGGPAVDTAAMHQQLRDLAQQDMRMQPALIEANHQQALADEATKASKLQEELTNAQDALAAAQEAGKTKGINIAEAAKLSGMSTTDFAGFFQSDAFGAFTAMIGGLKDLPKNEQASELGKLGIKNVRDIQNVEALAAKFDTIGPNVSAAQQQISTPTTLGSESGIMLATTAAKMKDAADALAVAASIVGDPLRKVLDEGLTSALNVVQQQGFDPLVKATQDLTDHFGNLDKALAGAAALQMIGAGGSLLGGLPGIFGAAKGAGVASASAASSTVTGASEALGAAGLASAGAGAAVTGAVGASVGEAVMADKVADYWTSRGVPEIATAVIRGLAPPGAADVVSGGKSLIQYGDVIINHPTDIEAHAEKVKQDVVSMLTNAWNAAGNSTPVSGTLGGSYSTRGGPR